MDKTDTKAKETGETTGKIKPGNIPIYIMGKRYDVPDSLTIMRAMEYAGYKLIRGCGCRSGFCGACATLYRKIGDYRIRVGLACQTMVEDGMYLTQLPFFPANKAKYNIDEIKADGETLLRLYPELSRCLSCNTCTKACPQDIKVMDYVQAALRGDISKAADLSFDCIMCGLCTARCPAEISQYLVAILCRRLYGKYIAENDPLLSKRVEEMESGKFNTELDKLTKMDIKKLKKLYNQRDIEKGEKHESD